MRWSSRRRERAWDLPAAARSLTDRWDSIRSELVGWVEPAPFDPESGSFELRPVSPAAYATQIRLHQSHLIRRINAALGSSMVRTLRVLPPGPATPAAADSGTPVRPAAPGAQAPVRTRETASPGCRGALVAHQAVHTEERVDPAIAVAAGR
ncbi:hypothetical protein [Streptomyces sp. NPDC056244]|uniref:hypothetical protein n=1 Tax=Streptomyces sp. NPDC056244 TaxID=3345762 RepID=UPI0035E268A9